MEEIREASRKKGNFDTAQGASSNQYKPLEYEHEYIPGIDQEKVNGKSDSAFTKRIKKGAWSLLAVGIAAMVVYSICVTSKSVDTSEEAVAALESHMSTTLVAGTKLLSSDDNYVGGDLTITHDSSDEETELYVWDYAAEDGDYVQVIVDGTPLGNPFMIKNKPVKFTVPTVGKIEIVGTRDGGGGITYAVYYGMNHTTYFNGVEEGGSNIYTLVRE
jgi:hypothetical protein